METGTLGNNISHLLIGSYRETNVNIIQHRIEDFYHTLYTEGIKERSEFGNIDLKTLSLEQFKALEEPFSEAEIRKALDDLDSDKTLGLDEFPIHFYRVY